ncbi:acetolactate synthase [Streptosporangium sp. NPDC087985]|uniref:acetolactate synthase n=1 Tax=Streptosporangium sp. NPDC087985 TaxID=3366196 RepID=UPI00382F41E8
MESPKHAGDIAVAVSKTYGIETMFTLSGGHVFPLYDGAVHEGMSILDVRHEQSAVFAAEATARLTRRPGLAVLTAGPGVTNGVSGVATAHFNGSPVVIMGGRAPQSRWGSGALQELDQPPLFAPITKLAFTGSGPDSIAEDVEMAFRTALAPHRGPVFLDFHMDHLFAAAPPPDHVTETLTPSPLEPDPDALAGIARLLAEAERPVLVLGSDVWMDRAEEVARSFAEEFGLPVIPNGQGRGILPAGHGLLVTRARGLALSQADLVIVAGTPLDFRLGYGWFGGKNGAPLAKVVHLADAPSQLTTHMKPVGTAAGDLSLVFWGLGTACNQAGVSPKAYAPWLSKLSEAAASAIAADAGLLASDSDPIHPMRIYGELAKVLADDAVVIGDGGDFVSYAGKYVEPKQPGNWLDPGPYGCLGTGLGYAIAARVARPSSQVVLLLGDGAAGFSLMDVDTLVRHRLPVVMICGNNGMWGLEKHPMQMLYGYDVAAELQPQCRYDQVVTALGGGGELVTDPSQIGPALRRAFDSGVPYMVNIATDPSVAYPRNTTGV